MTPNALARGLLLTLAYLTGIALALWICYQLSTLLVYLTLSGVLVLVAQGPVRWMEVRLRWPRTLAVALTLLLCVGVFIGIFALVIPPIVVQAHQIAQWNLAQVNAQMTQMGLALDAWAQSYGFSLMPWVHSLQPAQALAYIPALMQKVVGWVGELGMGLVAVLFMSFFLLKDQHQAYNLLLSLAPEHRREAVQQTVHKIRQLLSRYLQGLLWQSSLIFILYYIVLTVIGTPQAFLLAFLGALFNLIPYLGPLMTLGLTLVLSQMSQFQGHWQWSSLEHSGALLLGVLGVQLIDNYVSQPLIFSRIVRSHPLELFVVTLSFGWLFGLLGMMVAVPGYTIIKVLARTLFPQHPFVRMLTHKL